MPKIDNQIIVRDGYELFRPNAEIKAIIILFGGFPEKAKDVKREFKILKIVKENNVGVLILNYNKKLWLEQNEKTQLANYLQKCFKENQLPVDNIIIGGFSSGGNIALLISDFLVQKKRIIAPKGVFIIDSPIDLVALYETSKRNIKRNFSLISAAESTWVVENLGKELGDPAIDMREYEEYAVFTSKTNNIHNIHNLRNTKIRLYTEPDTIWWKKNRMADYEDMNAFYLKSLAISLEKSGFSEVELITTKNKGYRENGERHPHSWSIVDKNHLIEWVLAK